MGEDGEFIWEGDGDDLDEDDPMFPYEEDMYGPDGRFTQDGVGGSVEEMIQHSPGGDLEMGTLPEDIMPNFQEFQIHGGQSSCSNVQHGDEETMGQGGLNQEFLEKEEQATKAVKKSAKWGSVVAEK